MTAVTIELFASEESGSYAIRVASDPPGTWRSRRGLGTELGKRWSVDLESSRTPDFRDVDWEIVLDRVIGAYEMSDPIISSFEWPLV